MDRTDEFVAGLRAAAEYLEANRNLPGKLTLGLTINILCQSKGDLAAHARTMGRAEKFSVGNFYFGVRRSFGPVAIDAYANREAVCVRRQVGERVIEAKPATPERTEPIYEWDCPNLLEGGAR